MRDAAAGVGTLTFVEPKTKKFGALGHMITPDRMILGTFKMAGLFLLLCRQSRRVNGVKSAKKLGSSGNDISGKIKTPHTAFWPFTAAGDQSFIPRTDFSGHESPG